MNKFARIVVGVVVEVVDQRAFDTFNATVQAMFASCPAEVTPGYTREKDAWVAPPPPAPTKKGK